MEKLKIGTNQFDLIVNGVDTFTENMLTLRFIRPSEKTLQDLEDLLLNPQNTNKIELLNENLETTRILLGYEDLKSLYVDKDQELEYITGDKLKHDVVTAILQEKGLEDDIMNLKKRQEITENALQDLILNTMKI